MLLSSVTVALMVAAGIWLAPPAWRVHLLLLLPVVLVSGIHAVVFGHARYHLPVIPILALYAAALWHQGSARSLAAAGWLRATALVSVLLLLAIWARQVLIVDAPRVRPFIGEF